MKIVLNQAEIEDALRSFVSIKGISIDGKTIDVQLTAGRGPNGMTAELDINSEEQAAPASNVTSVKRKKPAAVESNVEEVSEDAKAEDVVEEETVEAPSALFGS